MMISKCYVWMWLPGATEPVVAGELQFDAQGRQAFAYGRSFLERAKAVSIYEPELPLRRGVHEPIRGLDLFSCLRDAAPDAWGRRVIANRMFGRGEVEVGRDIDERTYLLQSGSDRTGALDFQESASDYVSRDMDAATLADLHEAADREAERAPALKLVRGAAAVNRGGAPGARRVADRKSVV
jgi:serine/threonine-protein kinase HipA